MANVRNANTYHIDTEYSTNEELLAPNVIVVGVVVTATAAGGRLILADSQTSEPTKLDLSVATDGTTSFFDLSGCPVLFPNGIRPVTVTNVTATVIFRDSRS